MSEGTNGARADSPDRQGRGKGRAPFWVGFSISAVLHIVLVALYPFFARDLRDGPAATFLPEPSEPGGTQVLRVIEIAADPADSPDDPLELEQPNEVEIAPETVDLSDTESRFPDRYRSATDRLRAGQGDPRLWRPLDPSMTEPTPEEVARLLLLTAIESMNDSAMIVAERARRATDWTYTDDEGKTWGVSPGRLHLGDLSIPLPFGFGPPPDYNGDQARRAFDFLDIDRAAGTRAARESWKERLEAMEERRERRRAEEQAEAAEGTPPAVRPDTTRIRR